ncbi:MAG TPA: imidazolonepropionase [Anaerolineaceae bacterium]|nr:imidazolonepropionase [Anaerolineaceae bacterium]HPD63569.1 imidazolonepropionase [Anaerolineaceae bacterium]HQF68279.1 imidazolonepropionase [Anaerolineaceae bacterium]HQK04821.1 imidazolonepropionase [Anaerolineaceae bacterium]HRS73673.1 imidazolonepropionase [Anaerolineaceae bacterium]
MLLHSASQLLTLAGGPRRGPNPVDLGLILDGAVLVRDGLIADVGSTQELLARYPNEQRLDARGKAVLPGFIDPHTHLVWAGDRAAEFEMRLQGKTYIEIMAAGGGINATVRATRGATAEELYRQTRERADAMFRNGTTTAEAKTGYGLELQAELAQLETLVRLDEEGPLEIVPTFMPAHAVPPEFKGREDDYTRLVCERMLPMSAAWWKKRCPGKRLPFVDVFCETGAFNLAQTRRILTSARDLGFPFRAHVDEFENLGGAALAVELGAVSIEHAVKTSAIEIQALGKSETVVVSLPCTPFGLAEPHYTPARQMLDAGAILALATDLNPGTAWCENMQFVIALACRYLKLTPAEALAAATINAARAIRCEERLGSVEVGKQADLLILSVADFRQLAYRFGGSLVEAVIKRGHLTRVK